VVSIKLLDQFATKVGPLLANIVNPQAAVGLSLILTGMVIILFLIFEPRGIAHLWERIKTYYRLWPF
jgi:branched-chain amino acid transport system permease protein